MELKGQIALVTGGAGGIGAAIVSRLAKNGAHLAIVDIESVAADTLAELAISPDQRVRAWQCDVTKSKDVATVCRTIQGELGDPTILINNIGGSGSYNVVDVEHTTDEIWDNILSLNVGSVLRFCRAIVPAMKTKRYGKIVNMSSTLMNGMFGPAGTVGARLAYVAAKSAIVGLTKQLAKDLGPFGIAVNAIAPGFTIPDENARIAKKYLALSADQQRLLIADIPMGRPGTGDEVAQAVSFLSSPQNTYVSGQILAVDGGG